MAVAAVIARRIFVFACNETYGAESVQPLRHHYDIIYGKLVSEPVGRLHHSHLRSHPLVRIAKFELTQDFVTVGKACVTPVDVAETEKGVALFQRLLVNPVASRIVRLAE